MNIFLENKTSAKVAKEPKTVNQTSITNFNSTELNIS